MRFAEAQNAKPRAAERNVDAEEATRAGVTADTGESNAGVGSGHGAGVPAAEQRRRGGANLAGEKLGSLVSSSPTRSKSDSKRPPPLDTSALAGADANPHGGPATRRHGIVAWLKNIHLEKYAEGILNLGVAAVPDLRLVEESHLQRLDMKEIEVVKFIKYAKKLTTPGGRTSGRARHFRFLAERRNAQSPGTTRNVPKAPFSPTGGSGLRAPPL